MSIFALWLSSSARAFKNSDVFKKEISLSKLQTLFKEQTRGELYLNKNDLVVVLNNEHIGELVQSINKNILSIKSNYINIDDLMNVYKNSKKEIECSNDNKSPSDIICNLKQMIHNMKIEIKIKNDKYIIQKIQEIKESCKSK